MFKLIRDKVPDLMKQEGKVCNYAKAENDELYIALLRSKLVEEINEFLASGTIDELVDVSLVINTLLSANGISKEQFDELYAAKIATNGGFDNKYIGFFQDQGTEAQN